MNTSDSSNECFCGGKIERKRITTTIPLRRQKVLLKDVEADVCQNCGEIYLDGKMLEEVDARLKNKLVETV